MKIRVGVIFGGQTVEHEVSIITAIQAMNNMDLEKYEIIPIYIDKKHNFWTGEMLKEIENYKDFDILSKYAKQVTLCNRNGSFYLINTKGLFRRNIAEIDIAFPIVHGNNAEDGTIQGYLEALGIPYVGSKVTGSALGQDKVIMKQIFETEKLPIVPYTWFFDTDYFSNSKNILANIEKLGYPVIVKPATLGSSVGISVVKDSKKIEEAIGEAINYDSKIIVEKVVDNLVEVNCSVFGNYEYQQTSAIEEVMGTDEFLSYQDKYIGGSKGKMKGSSKGMAGASRVIPARISKELQKEVENISKKAFRTLNLSGICRIDFLINKKDKKIYINEPNTIPGSLSFYLWEKSGKTYKQLLDEDITLAIKDFKNKSKKTFSFDTNILSNFSGSKGLKGKLK